MRNGDGRDANVTGLILVFTIKRILSILEDIVITVKYLPLILMMDIILH